MVFTCEYGNKPSDFIKVNIFLTWWPLWGNSWNREGNEPVKNGSKDRGIVSFGNLHYAPRGPFHVTAWSAEIAAVQIHPYPWSTPLVQRTTVDIRSLHTTFQNAASVFRRLRDKWHILTNTLFISWVTRADGKRLATVIRTEVRVYGVVTVFTKTRRKAVIYTVSSS
jgi:hypothetical protein